VSIRALRASELLESADSRPGHLAEGVVFHHPGARQERRDFFRGKRDEG
jgi:hypothetical protein